MLKKRIIPCLDIKNGRTVKGVNFKAIRDAGDPVELAKQYVRDGADELVFLDITATIEKRKTLIDLVKVLANEINIPFTVGGGVSSKEDVSALLEAGADKISINSSAIKKPELVKDLSSQFGSQCIVVAIDTKLENDKWKVFINGGNKVTSWETLDWAKKVEKLGAGEILLTSMNNDGTKSGFDLDVLKVVSEEVNIPIIASGGAGQMHHFSELFQNTKSSAALAASIFHYQEINIPSLKQYLKTENIPMR